MQGSPKKTESEVNKFLLSVINIVINKHMRAQSSDKDELEKLLDLLSDMHKENSFNPKPICEFINYHFQDNLELQGSLRELFIVADWIDKIDNYEIPLEQNRGNLLGSSEVTKALFGLKESEEKIQRIEFLYKLANVLQTFPEATVWPRKTMKMKDFLWKDGVELYKKAIAEEGKSRAFREAVFSLSIENYGEYQWGKKLILWVGGPSASGKTTATRAAVQEAAKHMPIIEINERPNYVATIDGAIARQTSQMRQLVLQIALAKGYSGVKDLESYSAGLDIKNDIKKAALKHENLSLVIPETFATSDHRNEMNKYKEMNDKGAALHVFAQVVGDPAINFESTVSHMGNSRAWLSEEETFTRAEIKINNRNIKCESKAYPKPVFRVNVSFNRGVSGSQGAENYFKSINPDGPYLRITNDRMFVKKDIENGWQECKRKEDHHYVLTRRAFMKWDEKKKEKERASEEKGVSEEKSVSGEKDISDVKSVNREKDIDEEKSIIGEKSVSEGENLNEAKSEEISSSELDLPKWVEIYASDLESKGLIITTFVGEEKKYEEIYAIESSTSKEEALSENTASRSRPLLFGSAQTDKGEQQQQEQQEGLKLNDKGKEKEKKQDQKKNDNSSQRSLGN